LDTVSARVTGAGGFAVCWRVLQGLIALSLTAWLLVRVASVSLGEQDIAGLRSALISAPAAPLAMLDEHRNIWHEVGLLSVAIGRPIQRVYDLTQASAR